MGVVLGKVLEQENGGRGVGEGMNDDSRQDRHYSWVKPAIVTHQLSKETKLILLPFPAP